MQDLYQEETDRAIARMPAMTGPEVGAFDGFARGTAQTAMMNFAKAGRSVHLLGAVGPIAMDYFTGGTEAQDRYFKKHDEYFQKAVDFWTPDPDDVGVASQIAGTLLSTIPMMMASPAGAASALGVGVSEDLVKAGVSVPKALAVGASEAVLTYAGMKAPIFGKNLAQRVLAGGVGFNVVQGTAMRASAEAILQDTPAEGWFDAFDSTELWMDIVMGAVFGGIVHMTPSGRAQSAQAWEKLESMLGRNVKQIDRDAISILRQEVHKRVDSMPGKPLDASDVTAHINRAERAINLLMADEIVAVDDLPAARIIPDPERQVEAVRNIETLGESAEDVRVLEGLPKDEIPSPVESEMSARRASDIVNPIDRNASTEEKVRQLVALSDENAAVVEPVLRQLDKEIGSESKINFKDPENIVSKAERPSIRQKKPWHDVEHIRDAFRFKSVIDDLRTAMPKIAELVKEHGWSVVKVDVDKLNVPLAWGWRFAALDLRMPNGQIVEYQIYPRELEVVKDANHLLFENWRNQDTTNLSIADQAMLQSALRESSQRYGKAWNAYLYRVGSDAMAVRASSRAFATSLGSVTGKNDSLISIAEGMPAEPSQTPSTKPPNISGVESTAMRAPSSDLSTTGSIKPPDDIIPQNQANLTGPEAPGVPGETVLPPPRGDVGAAGAEGFMKLPPEQRLATYEEIGERFGGDTDLAPIIAQLAKAYIEEGSVAGRALLNKRFPAERMTKELGSREAGIEYVNGFDEALKGELERVREVHPDPEKPGDIPRGDVLDTVAEDFPRTPDQEAAGEISPLQFAAERFAMENPDLPVRIGTDTNGEAITTTARQMLDDANEAAARAREDIPLFEAAAACLLGGGR